jgi:hypothetical protein
MANVRINIRDFNTTLNAKRPVERGGMVLVSCPCSTPMSVHPDAIDEKAGTWRKKYASNPPYCDICVPRSW